MPDIPEKEVLRLERGQFGPLKAPLEFLVKPLTVFVGPQGGGKSLLSEILYFFRDAKYLLYRHRGRRGPEGAVTHVFKGLRAGEKTKRAVGVFVGGGTDARWEYVAPPEIPEEQPWRLSVRRNNRVEALKGFREHVEAWIQAWEKAEEEEPYPNAIFIPAERTYFSRFVNIDPQALGHRGLPIPVREFTRHLSEVKRSPESTEAQQVIGWAREALKGEAFYEKRGPYASTWQWTPMDTSIRLDIELISSGQMEAWPIVAVAQMLLDRQDEETVPCFVHIEEPEAHLFPDAQTAIARICALLVNRDFWITITTHSVDFLFALNNLLAAGTLLSEADQGEGLPPPDVRLRPEKVAVYMVDGGEVHSIVSQVEDAFERKWFWIDEDVLRANQMRLDAELTRIRTFTVHREEPQ